MVVSSGKVVVNPEGQNEGTYLELTLSNATSDKVYINVGKLVDIYTAKAMQLRFRLLLILQQEKLVPQLLLVV